MTTNNPDPLEVWKAAVHANLTTEAEPGEKIAAAAAIIAQHYAPVIAENEAETGWLIEREGMALWLTLTKYCDWTADSNDALRFARKRDAEAFIADCGLKGAFATEHRWD